MTRSPVSNWARKNLEWCTPLVHLGGMRALWKTHCRCFPSSFSFRSISSLGSSSTCQNPIGMQASMQKYSRHASVRSFHRRR